MKRAIAAILILFLLTLSHGALAEPTPSPEASDTPEATATATPSGTPSGGTSSASTGLVSFGVKGERVVRIQLRLRELGYFNYKPTGNFQAMTVEATKRFQQKQTTADGLPIMSDGTVGEQSMGILFEHSAVRADITASIPFGAALSGTPLVTGELVSWSEVKSLLTEGRSYKITDYNTGATFMMTVVTLDGHAEVECPTPTDTAAYKEAFGGEFNYSKRPAVISIDGRNVAASLQGWPHGEDTVSANEMSGHACLFFNGSTSHVANLMDEEHQKFIYTAAGRQ